MPHIVMPLRSNLIMQMLLDGNVYVACTWFFSYMLYMVVYQWHRLNLNVMLVYLLTALIETFRIYIGYVLNLSPRGPRSKLLLFSTLAACLPLMCASWYLHGDQNVWLCVTYNLWTVFIVVELIAGVGILWNKLMQLEQLPNWPAMEVNLNRLQCSPCKVYKL